eukprot:UN04494
MENVYGLQMSCRWCENCSPVLNPVKSMPPAEERPKDCDLPKPIPDLFSKKWVKVNPSVFRVNVLPLLEELRERYETYLCKHPELIPILNELKITEVGFRAEGILMIKR